ncbi:hypothetical protein [Streptomyces sp. BoleA5]|uniref:hypothetical protein n=1 Tax=Streptomyces sp. BoleA5 TaxID=1157637 RepID=UPI00055DA8A7|nr:MULTISPECIES: hypothetical protein [unclassified Streptomyces]MYX35390.1 hypothetical protein [Streptomyces sp. SID8377]
MSRWVVKRLTALRTRVRLRGDSGQTSFEYLGIAVVIAVIIGVLATTDIGQAVKTGILSAITRIVGGG